MFPGLALWVEPHNPDKPASGT